MHQGHLFDFEHTCLLGYLKLQKRSKRIMNHGDVPVSGGQNSFKAFMVIKKDKLEHDHIGVIGSSFPLLSKNLKGNEVAVLDRV